MERGRVAATRARDVGYRQSRQVPETEGPEEERDQPEAHDAGTDPTPDSHRAWARRPARGEHRLLGGTRQRWGLLDCGWRRHHAPNLKNGIPRLRLEGTAQATSGTRFAANSATRRLNSSAASSWIPCGARSITTSFDPGIRSAISRDFHTGTSTSY